MAEKIGAFMRRVLIPAAILANTTLMFAQTAPVRVLCSNGIREVVQEVMPQAEHAVGQKIAIQFSSSASLKQRIDAGETFDVTILTPDLIDDLTKQGKVAAGSSVSLARAGIGVGIRAGTPKPDISTPAAMKQTLLQVKSVTYTKSGASRQYIEKMYERMGITREMAPKVILQEMPGRAERVVGEGGADMVITLVSEILPTPGVQLVGPLPGDLQNYISFAGGVGSKASDAAAAKALLKFLASPAVAATYKAKGMEAR
jgi:molybdate transport system substrate-binding protein